MADAVNATLSGHAAPHDGEVRRPDPDAFADVMAAELTKLDADVNAPFNDAALPRANEIMKDLRKLQELVPQKTGTYIIDHVVPQKTGAYIYHHASEELHVENKVLHLVQQGDTIGEIAQKQGIGISKLLSANPKLTDPQHVIRPGDVLVFDRDTGKVSILTRDGLKGI